VIKIKFAMQDCGPCPHRQAWTQTQAASPRRTLTIRPQDRYQALQAARQRQASETFPPLYDQRAGIEGTLSQGIRVFGLRQARYRGQAKVHLQHALTAAALNFSRLFAWLMGQARATTRKPAFVRLAKPPA
jgi:transposase